MSAAFVVFDLDGTLIDGYEAIGDASEGTRIALMTCRSAR